MLVLSRQRDEAVMIATENTTYFEFGPDDLVRLRKCIDPDLVELSKRLLTAARGTIKVTIVDIRGDKTRLGFDAPLPVKIHREEVYKAIQREKKKTG